VAVEWQVMHEVERAVAGIAGRQDNVISRDQLLGAGLGRGAIAHRVKAGTIQRLHWSVYLLGAAPPTPMARARAAALACGDDAVVSHRSAAEVFGLLPQSGGAVDVTVAARNFAPREGITRHRVAHLPGQDVTSVRGLRVTSIARTICDLAATESRNDVMRAFQEALYRRVVTPRALGAVLTREPRRKGAPVIHSLIDDPRMTRSERERLLLKLIDQADLPKPVSNVQLHGHLVDIFWPDQRLILEFDGWGAHGHRLAFDKDRKRDQKLVAAGYRVVRVTDKQLLEEPLAVIVRIAQALRG
jgi:very-short-patch-repair endonuclease